MGLGGVGGSGQPGQIQGSDIQNAMFGTQTSIADMTNRYNQLGLGGTGATPSGRTSGAVHGVPGSGTTPTTPGTPASPGSPATPGTPGTPGGAFGTPATSGTPGTPASPASGPTGYRMDIGQAPSLTGGIPREFQGALGEGQFQDLSETTSAAVSAQQAKGHAAQGLGQLIGGI
jgi:hypothetical protein